MLSKSIPPLSNSKGRKDTCVPDDTNKCKYKTGKCRNERSSKRNGQPHQLCVYHRDKANMIQRKFDRQKRESERSLKVPVLHNLASPTSNSTKDQSKVPNLASMAINTLTKYTSNSSNAVSCLPSRLDDVKMFSPDSTECSLNENVWGDIHVNKYSDVDENFDVPLPLRYQQGYLSLDEIEFLCSAILE
ncbi:uncharacterized protein PHALS_03924 [Plasmopara halstedii]|uniref:Uncharacterized protein n=1 Tax=Plasmopara halstedii TaxID=4781 RepID=A0A0P1B1P2_PLAHL|nr:uncharacterized protein PHALS_03924 [Plasmopara halstedii]CEG47279.1 hypothetical protein PHALS_03924 [Plasmopara halstedii]|eukprot:XP_024583648.1 hypothetical protein PHALS_03924 [Plasmopara halstedii]